MNELCLVTTLLTLKFADDTFCLKSNPDLNILINDVNSEINKMAVWFRANILAVKGTVSRDFLLLVHFMNQFPPSPRVFH